MNTHRQIIVMRLKGAWMVRCHGSNERSFKEQIEALKSAVDVAHESGKDGVPAQVMLLSPKNYVARPIWTYGEDAYPPSFTGLAAVR